VLVSSAHSMHSDSPEAFNFVLKHKESFVG